MKPLGEAWGEFWERNNALPSRPAAPATTEQLRRNPEMILWRHIPPALPEPIKRLPRLRMLWQLHQNRNPSPRPVSTR